MAKPTTVQELDPATALRSGSFDSAAVLVLWCLRKLVLPILWIGLSVATVSSQTTGADGRGLVERLEDLDTFGELIGGLLSPLLGRDSGDPGVRRGSAGGSRIGVSVE